MQRLNYNLYLYFGSGSNWLQTSPPLIPMMKFIRYLYLQKIIYPEIVFGKEIVKLLSKERRNLRIVDVPCGNGLVTSVISKLKGAIVEGYDMSEQRINTAKSLFQDSNISFGVDDIFTVLQKHKYDIICMVNSLFCLSEIGGLLTLMYNALNERGKAIFIIPNTDSKNFMNFQKLYPGFNKRIISKSEAIEFFTKNRFRIETIKGICRAYYYGRKEFRYLRYVAKAYLLLLNGLYSSFNISRPSYYLFVLNRDTACNRN